jgi:hypothetical protein
VKALSRRLGNGEEEYDTLRPVADLHLAAMTAVHHCSRTPGNRAGSDDRTEYNEYTDSIMRELWDSTSSELRRLLVRALHHLAESVFPRWPALGRSPAR